MSDPVVIPRQPKIRIHIFSGLAPKFPFYEQEKDKVLHEFNRVRNMLPTKYDTKNITVKTHNCSLYHGIRTIVNNFFDMKLNASKIQKSVNLIQQELDSKEYDYMILFGTSCGGAFVNRICEELKGHRNASRIYAFTVSSIYVSRMSMPSLHLMNYQLIGDVAFKQNRLLDIDRENEIAKKLREENKNKNLNTHELDWSIHYENFGENNHVGYMCSRYNDPRNTKGRDSCDVTYVPYSTRKRKPQTTGGLKAGSNASDTASENDTEDTMSEHGQPTRQEPSEQPTKQEPSEQPTKPEPSEQPTKPEPSELSEVKKGVLFGNRKYEWNIHTQGVSDIFNRLIRRVVESFVYAIVNSRDPIESLEAHSIHINGINGKKTGGSRKTKRRYRIKQKTRRNIR